MKFLWILFLAVFSALVLPFIYQNTQPIDLEYDLSIISLNYHNMPVYLPVCFAFLAGMIFATAYFFIYTMKLRSLARWHARQSRKYKQLLHNERSRRQMLKKVSTQGTKAPESNTTPNKIAEKA